MEKTATGQPPKFFKDERNQTDESLGAERDKTNRSLSQARAETENETNLVVNQDRVEADQAIKTARIEVDAENENKSESAEESRLNEERARSDKAIEMERMKVDEALEKERESKTALANRLLERERKLTDKNLSSERAKTDSEVLRSSKLLRHEIEEHSKTKVSLTTRDEFMAIVSHDLRNPIGAAYSCAQMLLEDPAYSQMDPEIKHWIEFIQRNVDTSLRMISDLLDMERIAGGKLRLELDKCGLGKIVRQCVESFAHKASAKSILLKTLPIVGTDEIVCDDDRILQALSNLVGNAVKFVPEGGTVTVSAIVDGGEVQISVADTGPGIREEMLSTIFERFSQLGSNDRRGLGLGLYISKMLVEAHGGRIWVDSKIGEGSTFHFAIPIDGPAPDQSLH